MGLVEVRRWPAAAPLLQPDAATMLSEKQMEKVPAPAIPSLHKLAPSFPMAPAASAQMEVARGGQAASTTRPQVVRLRMESLLASTRRMPPVQASTRHMTSPLAAPLQVPFQASCTLSCQASTLHNPPCQVVKLRKPLYLAVKLRKPQYLAVKLRKPPCLDGLPSIHRCHRLYRQWLPPQSLAYLGLEVKRPLWCERHPRSLWCERHPRSRVRLKVMMPLWAV